MLLAFVVVLCATSNVEGRFGRGNGIGGITVGESKALGNSCSSGNLSSALDIYHEGKKLCNGTLISNYHIMTTAQCMSLGLQGKSKKSTSLMQLFRVFTDTKEPEKGLSLKNYWISDKSEQNIAIIEMRQGSALSFLSKGKVAPACLNKTLLSDNERKKICKLTKICYPPRDVDGS